MYSDVFNSFFCLFIPSSPPLPPSFCQKKEKNIHLEIAPPPPKLSLWIYMFDDIYLVMETMSRNIITESKAQQFSSSISSVCVSVWVCICLSLKRCESIDIDIMKFMLIFAEEWNTENEIKIADRIQQKKRRKKIEFVVIWEIVCVLRVWFILLVIVVEGRACHRVGVWHNLCRC